MTRLFSRRCKITVARPLASDFNSMSAQVTVIEEPRVTFKITKTLGKEPNHAEVAICNLAPTTRAELQQKGAKMVVQAGYEDSLVMLFIGDVTTAFSAQEGAEWVTKLQSGDGERAFLHSRVSESFAPGVRVPDVVRTVAGKLGVDLGDINKQLAGRREVFQGGYVAHGKASAELDKVLAALGLTWSIQDGRLQILAAGATNSEPVLDLNPDTGLIGSPEPGTPERKGGPPVWKIKSLIQPGMRPGGKIRLSCAAFNQAQMKILRVTHTGDTHGPEFTSDAEATPV